MFQGLQLNPGAKILGTRSIRMDGKGPSIPVMLSLGNPFLGLSRFDARISEDVAEELCRGVAEFRGDAGATLAFARSLEYTFAKVYEIPFPRLRATEFFPLNTEVPPGSLTYNYRQIAGTGQAAVINPMATDFPLVGLDAKEFPAPIVTTGCAWAFNFMDIARAALTNVPFESSLARTARYAIEFLGEVIAAVGVADAGVPGVTNAPGVTSTAQVSTGSWLTQIASIGAATPSTPAAAVAAMSGIITDVNAMANAVLQNTDDRFPATNLLMSPKLYRALKTAPRSPAFTDDSMLDYIRKMTGLEPDYWRPLATASGTGHGRTMVYCKDPEVVEIVRARMFTQFAPQQRMLNSIVPCIAEEGGASVHIPGGVTYMDDLDT